MNDLEVIENYLNGQLPADERTRFEATLRTDPAVANALAFYVLAKHTAKRDAREQRRTELDALRRPGRSAPMSWVAAASVLLVLGLSWSIYRLQTEPAEASQQADAYITTHFGQLSTTMSGGSADRLAQGVDLYNQQKFADAQKAFDEVLTQQPDNDRALKFAGLAALRQGEYDRAIDRFHRLSTRTDLLTNPGIFLEALAHLRRGRPMDKAQTKKLLDEVIRRNLDGKPEAEALLRQL